MQVNKICPEVQSVETIDLDGDTASDDEVQFVDHVTNVNKSEDITMTRNDLGFVDLLQANKFMDEIVKTCLGMDNVVATTRVINNTLIPLYRDASKNLKTSQSFGKLLKKTLKRLKKYPEHKFFHIKVLCERMKAENVKRKVAFVTLATNLNQIGTGGNVTGKFVNLI